MTVAKSETQVERRANPRSGDRMASSTLLRFPKSAPLTRAVRAPARQASRNWLVASFDAIDLTQLNTKADMLKRLDNKYVIRSDILQGAIPLFARYFDILEMQGKRAFAYDTTYFDDNERTTYFEHHQGRRQRCKVRIRRYNDAQACFVEVKLKDKRGITVKKRLEYPIEKYGVLDERAMTFIQKTYHAMYGRDFDLVLQPVLEVRYQRISLVAKQGGERMTIDSRMVFATAAAATNVDEDIFIVETKSANANGIADKILRSLHQHRASYCSKYCIAAASLGLVLKQNNFFPVLRKLDLSGVRNETRRPMIGLSRQATEHGSSAMLPTLETAGAI